MHVLRKRSISVFAGHIRYEVIEGVILNMGVMAALLATTTFSINLMALPETGNVRTFAQLLCVRPPFRRFAIRTMETEDFKPKDPFDFKVDLDDESFNIKDVLSDLESWGWGKQGLDCFAGKPERETSVHLLAAEFPMHKMNAWVRHHPGAEDVWMSGHDFEHDFAYATSILFSTLICSFFLHLTLAFSKASYGKAALRRWLWFGGPVLIVIFLAEVVGFWMLFIGFGRFLESQSTWLPVYGPRFLTTPGLVCQFGGILAILLMLGACIAAALAPTEARGKEQPPATGLEAGKCQL